MPNQRDLRSLLSAEQTKHDRTLLPTFCCIPVATDIYSSKYCHPTHLDKAPVGNNNGNNDEYFVLRLVKLFKLEFLRHKCALEILPILSYSGLLFTAVFTYGNQHTIIGRSVQFVVSTGVSRVG